MTPEGIEEQEHLAEGRRLAEKVDGLVLEGKQQQARSVVARNWQDAAPELPLRYPVVLESLAVRLTAQLARYLSLGGETPRLDLELSGKQVIKGQISISGRRLGDLPRDEAAFLSSLGEAAQLFEPRLTAIRLSAAGEPEKVEIEMVRPELRHCSSCGRLHAGEEINCADCRAKRRPKDPSKAESEATPVALHEAMDAVLVDDAANN